MDDMRTAQNKFLPEIKIIQIQKKNVISTPDGFEAPSEARIQGFEVQKINPA